MPLQTFDSKCLHRSLLLFVRLTGYAWGIPFIRFSLRLYNFFFIFLRPCFTFFYFPDVVCQRYGEPHHCASPFYALTAFWFRFSNFKWKTTTSGCFSTRRKRNFVSYQETEKVRSAGGDCSNKLTSNLKGVIFLMSLQALEQGVDEDEFSPSGENRFFQSNRKEEVVNISLSAVSTLISRRYLPFTMQFERET